MSLCQQVLTEHVSGHCIKCCLLGEIIQMTSEGMKPVAMIGRPNPVSLPAFCIFEYVYFARPDSVFEGIMLCLVCVFTRSNESIVVILFWVSLAGIVIDIFIFA